MSKKNIAIKEMFDTGYTVLDNGLIMSPKGNKVKTFVQRHGKTVDYLQFTFRSICVTVHRMVAYKKFGSIIFEKGVQVRHLDNDSFNNRIENIGIGNNRDNTMDKPLSSRKRAADHLRKIEQWQVLELINAGKTRKEVAKILGVHRSTVGYHANSPSYNIR